MELLISSDPDKIHIFTNHSSRFLLTTTQLESKFLEDIFFFFNNCFPTAAYSAGREN